MIYLPDERLLLTNVKRDSSGKLLSGNVVNGEWIYKRRDGKAFAYSGMGGRAVNSWDSVAEPREVEIPKDWRGDYNEIISRADEELC